MMDISDGVAKDVGSLTPPGLVASVWPPLVPATAAAHAAARRSGRPAWEHALTDGEDYQLLVVVRARPDERGFAARWAKRFGRPLHFLGRFQRRASPGDVDWSRLHGYEHLR